MPDALEPGTYFGELGLLFNCSRTATVVSSNYCSFAVISKAVFTDAPDHFKKTLFQNSYDYIDGSKLFKIKMLKQIEYFESYELCEKTMFYD